MKRETSALVSDNYEKLPRSMNRANDKTFDRIYKYYHVTNTRIELTQEEEMIRERWEKAWFVLCRHNTQKDTADILVKIFGISRRTAYDDANYAMMLFGNPKEDFREAKRAIAETMALNGAKRCWKNGDMDGYWKFLKEYKEINRLNLTDDELNKFPKDWKPTQVIIVADAEILKKEAKSIQDQITKDIESIVVE